MPIAALSLTLVACAERTEAKADDAPPPPAATEADEVKGPLTAGAPVPELTLKMHDGTELDLSKASADGMVLVYFYPKDDTPGCTVEAKGLRDIYPQLTEAGLTVVGVSTQDATSHQSFVDSYELPFGLAVDGAEIAAAFGVPMRGGLTARQSFLLADGKVAKAWEKVNPSSHAAEVLEAAREAR